VIRRYIYINANAADKGSFFCKLVCTMARKKKSLLKSFGNCSPVNEREGARSWIYIIAYMP
jgi:hypothetical protein